LRDASAIMERVGHMKDIGPAVPAPQPFIGQIVDHGLAACFAGIRNFQEPIRVELVTIQ